MRSFSLGFLHAILLLLFSSCTTPPPKGDDTSYSAYFAWAFDSHIEENYLPDGKDDYAIVSMQMDLEKHKISQLSSSLRVFFMLFEQPDYTQVYLFSTVIYPKEELAIYRKEVLDSLSCFPKRYDPIGGKKEKDVLQAYKRFQKETGDGVLNHYGHCILSVFDYRLEKGFYEKYMDRLWVVPVGTIQTLSETDGTERFLLNQYRAGQRRLALFDAVDITKHPVLQRFITELKNKTGLEKHIRQLLPSGASDVERLKQIGTVYSPDGILARWFSHTELNFNRIYHEWIYWPVGLVDRTLREVQYKTGLNEPLFENYVDALETPSEGLYQLNKLIYTKAKTVILPDSFRLLQNLDTLVISADARVPEQLDIILSLKKLRWLVFWQPYKAAEIRDIIAEMETQNLPALQEVWFSCTDCYLENNADGVVETQNLASLPPRYIIKDYQAIKRKFGLIE